VGELFVRRVADLGPGLPLAPERFDPRRRLAARGGARLGDVAELAGELCAPAALPPELRALVLDTTHAREGFVFAWHAPVAPAAIGSAKRRLAPGDVIVSRLRPYLRQIAYVDPALFARVPGGNAVLASPELFALRGRGGFDAAALVPYLLSAPVQAALAAAQEGGHHPRVSREALEALSIPASLVERSRELGERVRALVTRVRAGLDAGTALVAEAGELVGERRVASPRRRGRDRW
jgi:hypothetical protein